MFKLRRLINMLNLKTEIADEFFNQKQAKPITAQGPLQKQMFWDEEMFLKRYQSLNQMMRLSKQ